MSTSFPQLKDSGKVAGVVLPGVTEGKWAGQAQASLHA